MGETDGTEGNLFSSLVVLVRWHRSKFQANSALFDISMKFATLIEVITDIVPSWKSIGFHGNRNLLKCMKLVYQQIRSFQWFQLIYQIRFALV